MKKYLLRKNTINLFTLLLGIIFIFTNRNIAEAAPSENEIRVTDYATKDELLDKDNFAMSGHYVKDRKGVRQRVKFGYYEKNGTQKPRLWNIAGADVDGELVLVCDADYPFTTMTYNYPKKFSYQESNIREYLTTEALNFFTTAEKKLMLAEEVTTKANGWYESTEDKLYLVSGNCTYYDGELRVGKCSYNEETEGCDGGSIPIQLRNPNNENDYYNAIWMRGSNDIIIYPQAFVEDDNPIILLDKATWIPEYYTSKYDVVPVCELDTTNLLFASSVPVYGTSSVLDDEMTLRFDGKNKIKSEVNVEGEDISVKYTTGDVSNLYLRVQGRTGRTNWVFSKAITQNETFTAGSIMSELGLSSIDLSECRIWLEVTEDNVTYAKNAKITVKQISISAPWNSTRTGVETPVSTTLGCDVTKVQYVMFTKILDEVKVGDNCSIEFIVKLADGYSFADDVKCYWNGILHTAKIVDSSAAEKKFVYDITVPETAVAVPQNVKAVDHQSGQPKLVWKSVMGADEYNIYYQIKGKKYVTFLDTVRENSYIGKSFGVGDERTYYVTAVDSGVESSRSEGVTIECKAPVIPEVIITNNAAGLPLLSLVQLSDPGNYIISRSTGGKNYELLKVTSENVYVDSTAKVGETYYYVVCVDYDENNVRSAACERVSCTCLCASDKHIYSEEWKSDESTHWKECTKCHNKEDVGLHTGGTATCLALAKCSECGAEYGSLAGHIYGKPVFEWKDLTSAKAVFTCLLEETHTDSAAAVITSEITKAATVTEEGIKTYTATVEFAGKKYTDIKTETIAKLEDSPSGKDPNPEENTDTPGTDPNHGGNADTPGTDPNHSENGDGNDDLPSIASVELSAKSYVYNGKAKKPSVIVKDTKGNILDANNYTVKYPSGRKNIGTYTVKVTFKGNYSGTKNIKFTINPVKTSISSVKASKNSLTVKWKKKTTQVTGYEVQYSTSKTFKSGNKSIKISSYKTTSKMIKKLKSKKTYYVRIRTYKTVSGKKYYSDWSSVKKVKVK